MVRWIRRLWREAVLTGRWLFPRWRRGADCRRLGPVLAIALTLRAAFITQPMRYDEAFTFLDFVNRGLVDLFHYPVPNNHVAHTLLVRLSVEVFGGHPAAIRFPALVAGMLVVALAYALARRLSPGGRGGLVAAAACAVWPVVVLFDTMARGYSLVALATLVLLALCLRAGRRPAPSLLVLIALTAALGLFTVPSFLFPLAGAMLWLVLLAAPAVGGWWRAVLRVVAPVAGMTAGLAAALYLPVVLASGGIGTLVGNRFVASLAFGDFLERVPGHLAQVATSLVRDVPPILLLVLLGLVVAAMITGRGRQRLAVAALLPALLVGAAAVFLAKRAIPFDRTWLYLVPVLLVVADVGSTALAERVLRWLRPAVVAGAAIAAGLLMAHGTIADYDDTGAFPEADAVALILGEAMDPSDQIDVGNPAALPLEFAFWYHGLLDQRQTAAGGAARRRFVVVQPSSYSLADLGYAEAERLVAFGDAEIHVVELPAE